MQHPDHQPIRTDEASTNGHSPNRVSVKANASVAARHSAVSNFDALDYASIASVPINRDSLNRNFGNPPVTSDRSNSKPGLTDTTSGFSMSSNDIDFTYGELDPYVDPAELMNKTTQNNITATETPNSTDSIDLANQALEKIQGFEQALLANENLPVRIGPSVEIIAVEQATNQPGNGPANVLALQTETGSASVVPIVNQETGETVFDVRDFSDSANGTIEMIPNAYEVDPETFDYEMANEPLTQLTPQNSSEHSVQLSQSEMYVNPIDDGQIFVAGAGDVIEVNGSDGFDHIDLACFDVKCATFSEQVIKVDDQNGSSFEVRYQDVSYAVFADGVEVRLD